MDENDLVISLLGTMLIMTDLLNILANWFAICGAIFLTMYESILFIYLLHLFTQGKPKQLTLVFIGALHSFHKIVTNMYVQSIIQYSQIART